MHRTSLAILLICLTASVAGATTSPRDGGPLPAAILERIAADPDAYQFKNAWLEKARRARDARALFYASMPATAPAPMEIQVSGTMRVPVLAGYYSGGSSPGAIAIWQDQLFGTNPTGSVTDYFDEVSYGALTMTGTVMGWTQAAQPEAFYAGSSNGADWNNPDTHFGEFIKELLHANDGSVDFGQYDNDGPDGIPNSGDDDGVVDLLALIQPFEGGECSANGANGHIWSHKGIYSAWNASGAAPYTTDDARSGGGFIQVDEYSVQPAWNCGGSPDVIDIGIFCHEFGHALGLPDLYDTSGMGEGIGHWGLMGSGNWNTPASPAHPSAWTRVQMGWVTPTLADWQNPLSNIPQINTSATAFKLPFTDPRFRRAQNCVIGGSWSLYCGLTVAEGTARGWKSAGPNGGYGSSWSERIERTFTLSDAGVTPVTLQYDYRCDMETGYDFAYAVIDVQGSESVLATYTGATSGSESVDITSYIGGLSQGDTYVVRFRVESDFAIADDDSVWDSDCGALIVDNISLSGGGENYATDFETLADGWHSPGAHSEYWLVENRQPVGFDANLHGSGLLIWHVDDAVMNSAAQGNSAGAGSLVRGVVLEEADGQFDLNNPPTNRGEASDPWPGTTANTDFAGATTPNSASNSGHGTEIAVTNIGASGATMGANLRAGDPGPAATTATPNSMDNDEVSVDIVVDGADIHYGATFVLSYGGGGSAQADAENMVPSSIRWVDDVRIEGTVNPYSKSGGLWDLVVTNPDGQSFTLDDAVMVNFRVPAQLASARIRAAGDAVRLEYMLLEADVDERFRLYRTTLPAEAYALLVDDLTLDRDGILSFSDDTVEPGRAYAYLLESYRGDGSTRELHRGSATVPAGALRLDQNHPNPFNPLTTVPFYLPERSRVRLEVFDVRGAHVTTLAEGIFSAGAHRVEWNGVDGQGNAAASGVYYLRLQAGPRTLQRKMLLLK